GLVQTVYPLPENTGLALTTAKYYTPSGRLIQRDYQNTSFFDYYNHKDLDVKNPNDVKMTDSGRTVYGGGGISPDEKFVTPKMDVFQGRLLVKFAFFNFAKHYFATHEAKLPKNWAPDLNTMNDLHAFLLKEGFVFTEAQFAQHHDWMKRLVRREMYVTAFSFDEAIRVTVETDPIIEKALEALPKAKALLDSAKRTIAQRTGTK
ncbi:MAG: S41 family peptidase, partial [Bryobacteraceae bacterium]